MPSSNKMMQHKHFFVLDCTLVKKETQQHTDGLAKRLRELTFATCKLIIAMLLNKITENICIEKQIMLDIIVGDSFLRP